MGFTQESLNRWRQLLVAFTVGQTAWQLLRMGTGFALIRFLTKEDYATYTLVFTMQAMASVFVDLGLSGSLVALIGDKYKDRRVVGRYVAVAKYYRNRLLGFGAVGLAVVLFFATQRFAWDASLGCFIWLFLVVSLYLSAQESFYDPILALQQRLKMRYLIWNTAAFLRLMVVVVAYGMGMLSLAAALLAAICSTGFSSLVMWQKARPSVAFPEEGEDLGDAKKEALALTLPKIPEAVFFAIRGQVTILIISILGQYDEIASIGALSKIGLLFMLPRAFTSTLVLPWFSKLAKGRVLSGFWSMSGLYWFFGLSLLLANYFFPEVFLWILGAEYQDLDYEVFLFSISSVFSLLAGLCFTLSSSRKWVFYWTGPVSIVSYLVVLLYFLIFIDLTSIANVILLSIVTNATNYLLHQAVFLVGYLKSKRLDA
ncbi:MAG: oligosaccharide flippase family protein [Verrucomicrobiota bacterium]